MLFETYVIHEFFMIIWYTLYDKLVSISTLIY